MTRFTLWGLSQFDPTLFDDIMLPEEIDKQVLLNNIMDKSGDLYVYYQQPYRAKVQIHNWFKMHYENFSRMIKVLLEEYEPLENTNRDEYETIDGTSNNSNVAGGSDTVGRDVITQEKLSGSDIDTLSGSDANTLSGTDKVEKDGTNIDTLSGNDVNTLSGNDLTENNGGASTNYTENQVSAFDATSYQPHDKSMTNIDTDSKTTYGKVDTTDYGKVDTYDIDEDTVTTYGKVDTTTYGKKDTLAYGKQTDGTIADDTVTNYGRTDTSQGATTNVRHLNYHGNLGTMTTQYMVREELALRVYNLYDVIAEMFESDILIQVY